MLVTALCFFADCLIHQPAQHTGDQHIGQSVAQHDIHAHQIAVNSKAYQPHQQVGHIKIFAEAIFFQHKEIGCGVKEALEKKRILKSRYDNYLQFLKEIEK